MVERRAVNEANDKAADEVMGLVAQKVNTRAAKEVEGGEKGGAHRVRRGRLVALLLLVLLLFVAGFCSGQLVVVVCSHC